MAHYAELDENNIVLRVIPGIDESQGDGEKIYQSVSKKVWKRTSYNTIGNKHMFGGTPFRKNYAGVGFYYDAVRDAFIPPKPFNAWILNEDTCMWEPPIPYPEDGESYVWDDFLGAWRLAN